MHVGYVGLGAMGSALARRLLAGHTLSVCDLNSAAVAAFEKLGASAAPSAADLARRCDIVLLCLPRSSDVRKVIFGPGGLAEGLTAGKIVIDQTSGVPSETRDIAQQLAARGVAMIDAPVAGGVPAAEEGTITIMASGPVDAYEKALPILHSISRNVHWCRGPLGNGQAIKLVNNSMNAACRLATLEVVAMGKKMGLSLKAMTDSLNSGAGRNRTSKAMLPALIEGKASTNFSLSLMLKDMNQAASMGMECGAPMAITNIVRGLLQIGVNTLGENARLEDVVGLIESMAGTRLTDVSNAASAQGPATMSDLAKVVDNAVDACNRLITYENAAMGFKYGLAIEDMSKVINTSSGWSGASERILPVLGSGGQTADVPLQRVVKDLDLACRMGMGCGAPMLIANTVRSIFEAGANELGGTADIDEIAGLFETMADTKFAGG